MKEWWQEYAGLLAVHLEHPEELHLFEAYTFGKKCAEEGIPASQVINAHFDILESGEVSLTDDRVLDSQEFLLETTLAMAVSSSSAVEATMPEKALAALYNEAVVRFRELRELKEKLRASEEKYRELYDEAIAMLWSTDESGAITICNNTTARTLGYEKSELVGRHLSTVMGRECIERFSNGAGGFHGENEETECLLRRKDEQTIRALVQTKTVLLDDGKLSHVDFTCRDITERKRAEKERLLLATAIEQSADGIVITDKKGTIEYINPAFERVSGYSREETIGCNFRILKSDQHSEAFYRAMWKTISSGETWTGHILNKMKDGGLCEIETTISPVRDRAGIVTNFISVNRDVTHEVGLAKQLRQAQKMEAIGTLAGGIAHDFNNILTAILGNTEMALYKLPEGSPVRGNLDGISRAAYRATDLVHQILAFSRQSEQERKPVEIALIVKEALKLLRASLPSTIRISQKTAVSSRGGVVRADPTQIHQVLMNLCTNAAYAMNERGGILEVDLEEVEINSDTPARYPELKPGPHLSLTVTDTGHGMDRSVMDRIFDPFFTTKGPGKGTGMGLAVVHGIVKSHGGAIAVHSEPGKGTTFCVFLPEIKREASPEAEVAAGFPSGNERILFVDDEEALVDLGREMLEFLGYEVTTKMSSVDALKTFRAQPGRFDLVITDQTMPNLTGIKLAEELLLVRPDIPIILQTGFSEVVTAERANAVGIRAFVMKPLVMQDMAITIRRLLDERIRVWES